jgi:Holliday junction DNA helicase RuvA
MDISPCKVSPQKKYLLKNVKGLGLKTAQKIIVELSGKLMAPGADDGGAQPGAGGSFDEALAALSMLGFARAPAEKVLRGVLRESPAAPVEELIRMALKKL